MLKRFLNRTDQAQPPHQAENLECRKSFFRDYDSTDCSRLLFSKCHPRDRSIGAIRFNKAMDPQEEHQQLRLTLEAALKSMKVVRDAQQAAIEGVERSLVMLNTSQEEQNPEESDRALDRS